MPDRNSRRAAVNFIIKSRADRKKYFSGRLLAEAAWDMLLALYAASLDEQEVPIIALARCANASELAVTRWVDALLDEGLVIRSARGVSLSEKGWFAMDSYFEGIALTLS